MKGTTGERGYGYAHQRARRQALAAMVDEQPCVRCGEPMYHWQLLDLDHADDDRSVYLGLAHRGCNRSAGAVRGNRMRGRAARSWVPPVRPKPQTSRDW
ncbi:hypothetical protein [Actinomadura sp. BRA 177]|uniref:hypothetical protein n=1 Tax=Actinomadura sp. BRA 177 TaxID=2745202 RepID=UPI001595658A|nr:hypothetical protein [Actinomadura sp. BRA 177]NVI88243.1 hypothetical protein [Actinomadura sp. BRA 177]